MPHPRLKTRSHDFMAWRLVSIAVPLAVLGMCPTQAPAQRPADTVQLVDGNPVRGEVKRTTPESVEIISGGSARSIPTGDIRQIVFGGEPTALRSARDSVLEGDCEQALRSLERVTQDDISDDLIRQDVAFYRAYCQAKVAMHQGSGAGAAAKALLSFAQEYRESWHLHQTAEMLGDLALKIGRPDQAARFYGQLTNSSAPETRLRGTILEADAMRQQGPGHYPDAIKKYDAALRIDVTSAAGLRLKQLATIGRTRCGSTAGEAGQGIATLEQIINECDVNDTDLLAQAYVAMGACYMSQNMPQDATLALLHVDLLFNGNPESHAESLYRLSQLWPQLGKPDRAADARNRLRSRYGHSSWAQQ